MSSGACSSVVVLSSQRWEEPLATNRQRIPAELARRGARVLYVDMHAWLGGSALDRTRPLRTRLQRLTSAECVEPTLWVRSALNPLPWSWRSERRARANARIEAGGLRRLLRRLSMTDPAALVYDPRGIEVARRLGMPAVYDCVDDHAETAPEAIRELVRSFDESAAAGADVVTATTEPLAARMSRRNPNTRLVPNAADYEHFASGAGRPIPDELSALDRPILGFAGNISALKFDPRLVRAAALARPGWSFVLVGPVAGELERSVEPLRALPNVRLPGLVDYALLPAWLAGFDVGLIPYLSNRYNSSSFPLKLYEYLAVGLPVIASGLPSLPALDDRHLIQVSSGEELVAAAERLLADTSPSAVEERRQIAARNTWSARADRIADALDEARALHR